jgi:hypothetical protein
MLSTLSPQKSNLNGFSSEKEKSYIIPPLSANCPGSLTKSTFSNL